MKTIQHYLVNNFTEPVRDPIWKNIYFSRPLINIIRSESFQKLSRIKQLGPIFQIYPGATHTRFSHSLGVYYIAKRIIERIIQFDNISLSLEGVKAFLSAALLHDIGHFPYTHSLKELPLKEHEELTAEIILSSDIKNKLENDLGTDPNWVAAIVDDKRKTDNNEILFYRKLLSGVLDPDKLDYLNRDAFFCGVPYGIQDLDFAINKIIPISPWEFCIEERGITAIENILFSKYLMYRSIYWHKTVRIATAMIKKALYTGLKNNSFISEDLYGLDDDDFYKNFSSTKENSMSLIKDVFLRKFHKVSYSCTFDEKNKKHINLENLNNRIEIENEISKELSKNLNKKINIIIDVPEKINFETNLNIKTKNGLVKFNKAGSVFTKSVISDFTKNIRKIRVLIPEENFSEKTIKMDFTQWI